MRFGGFNSLEELFYSHLLPGTVVLLTLTLIIGVFDKNLMYYVLKSNLNNLLVAILGFIFAIILGNIIDAIRHYYLDRVQDKYGEYRNLYPSSPKKEGQTCISAISEDPVCDLVAARGSVAEKMQLRDWLRFNQYYLGELLGNVALVAPFFLGLLSYHFTLYLRVSMPLVIVASVLAFLVGVIASWFMFKVSSIYICNYKHNQEKLSQL